MNPLLSRRLRELALFVMNGGFAFAVSVGFLYGLVTILHVPYLVATTVVFITVTLLSFLLNKKYAFGTEKRFFSQEVKKYYGVAFSSLLLNLLSMYICIEFFSLSLLWASILTGFWLLFYNYLMHAYWSFRNSP